MRSKTIAANDKTSFEDFVHTVIRAYDQRQFNGFSEQSETDAMQICLELTEKVLDEEKDASDEDDEGLIIKMS